MSEMMRIQIIILLLLLMCLSCGLTAPNLSAETLNEAFIYDKKGARDPFVPLITGEIEMIRGLSDVQSIDDITLEGILWDPGGGSVAVLNGHLLSENQRVGTVMIQKIEEKRVILSINDERHELLLLKKKEN